MSTTLESRPRTARSHTAAQSAPDRLRHHFAACRVKFKLLGTSKALSPEQKNQAAEAFGAESEFLSAGKRMTTNALVA